MSSARSGYFKPCFPSSACPQLFSFLLASSSEVQELDLVLNSCGGGASDSTIDDYGGCAGVGIGIAQRSYLKIQEMSR
jgi:hypothetical protein